MSDLATIKGQRRWVIAFLTGRVGAPRKYRGLDARRVHFECGCNVLPASCRARRVPLRRWRPEARTWICPEHRATLGTGEAL